MKLDELEIRERADALTREALHWPLTAQTVKRWLENAMRQAARHNRTVLAEYLRGKMEFLYSYDTEAELLRHRLFRKEARKLANYIMDMAEAKYRAAYRAPY